LLAAEESPRNKLGTTDLPLTVPAPLQAAEPAARRDSHSSRTGAVLVLQARALAHEHFRSAAAAVVTELATRLGCERVSIGLYRQGRLRIGAISGTADIRAQQNIVRAIVAAMEEAIDQNSAVIHPLPSGSSPSVTLAHAELSHANGQLSICSVPIVGRNRAYGALLFERREAFDPRSVEAAKYAATFVGPVLELKHRIDQPLSGHIVDAVTPRHGKASLLRPGVWQLGTASLVLALLVAAFWPASFRIVAPARVEGEGQRIVAAPVDGFIRTVHLRPGASVQAGQVLLTLDDHDLALEREKSSAEIAQLDKQYRDALNKDDAAPIVIARSKLEQAQAQLELIELQLDRVQLKAPLDGVLLSGDLAQSIGMPVKRGQELMTVAPDRSFRIVAEVDEQDVAVLRDGQSAQVLFGAFAQDAMAARVTRIAPVATTLDGRNVFEVDARIQGSTDALRPGLRGVMRIDIEPSTLGRIWWHRASLWLQRTLWRVLG
jgi:Barrel-sandwich domain of CusB or HlyD membrane-fusion/GAF domain